MSPQLIAAIIERIKAGLPVTEIINELMATGYTTEVANEAYVTALNQLKAIETGETTTLVQTPSGADFNSAASSTEIISISGLLRASWQLAIQQSEQMIMLGVGILVVVVAGFALFVLSGMSAGMMFLFIIPGMILILPVMVILSFIIMRALLARNLNQSLSTHTGWVFKHLWPLLLVTILTTIIIQVGLAFFVIPGIIAIVYLMFAVPLVVDGKATAIEAMKLSIGMVKGRFFAVLLRIIVINIVLALIGGFVLVALGVVVGMLMTMSPFLAVLFVPVYILLMFGSFCGLVALYESVKSLPPTK